MSNKKECRSRDLPNLYVVYVLLLYFSVRITLTHYLPVPLGRTPVTPDEDQKSCDSKD